MVYTLYYLSVESEGSGASVPSERGFSSCKVMSQFIRRHKIKKWVCTVDGQPQILIGNKYLSISDLGLKMAKILTDFSIVNPQ